MALRNGEGGLSPLGSRPYMVEGHIVLKACGFKEWQRGSEPLRLEALMSLKTHLIFNPFF